MFHVDIAALLIERPDGYRYEVPVIETCWYSFCSTHKDFVKSLESGAKLNPKLKLTSFRANGRLYVCTVKREVAEIIAKHCGDPRMLFS